MTHSFNEKLEYSLKVQQKFDIEILKDIHDWADVVKTPPHIDKKTGIDYIATLKTGVKIKIDAKTREPGCSKWWIYGEPELAVEVWSERPTETQKGKIGWTFDDSKDIDYILYTFPEQDTNKFYYVPFQLLKKAAKKNFFLWKEKYGIKNQSSERTYSGWGSRAIFVPASILLQAIQDEMTGTRKDTICLNCG